MGYSACVWILVNPVSAFVIPSEIGKMYKADGQEPPMTGWTGLWLFPGAILLVPAIVWFVKVQRGLNRYWEGKAPARLLSPPDRRRHPRCAVESSSDLS